MRLTPREKQLYELMLTHPGSMKQIAHEMGLMEGTAKVYLQRLKLKIGGSMSRPALMQREILRLRASSGYSCPTCQSNSTLCDVPAWEI